jgi:hypothetical protein
MNLVDCYQRLDVRLSGRAGKQSRPFAYFDLDGMCSFAFMIGSNSAIVAGPISSVSQHPCQRPCCVTPIARRHVIGKRRVLLRAARTHRARNPRASPSWKTYLPCNARHPGEVAMRHQSDDHTTHSNQIVDELCVLDTLLPFIWQSQQKRRMHSDKP